MAPPSEAPLGEGTNGAKRRLRYKNPLTYQWDGKLYEALQRKKVTTKMVSFQAARRAQQANSVSSGLGLGLGLGLEMSLLMSEGIYFIF